MGREEGEHSAQKFPSYPRRYTPRTYPPTEVHTPYIPTQGDIVHLLTHLGGIVHLLTHLGGIHPVHTHTGRHTPRTYPPREARYLLDIPGRLGTS